MPEIQSTIINRFRSLADALFDLPVESVTAWARLILAILALIVTEISVSASYNEAIFLTILLGYIVFSTLVVIMTASSIRLKAWAAIIHGVDVAFSITVMLLTDGVTSPFFVFFQFALIAATLRWNWRGALAISGILTTSLWALYLAGVAPRIEASTAHDDDLRRMLLRSGFLLVGGAMLAYMGAYRERVRQRFARLAAWPGGHHPASNLDLLKTLLPYSAEIFRAPRLLVIWHERDEPSRHVALWAQERLQYSREEPDLFGTLVEPAYEDCVFSFSQKTTGGGLGSQDVNSSPPVDQDLQQVFSIGSALSASFSATACYGRIFFLDRATWNEDDYSLVAVIASRIGTSLDEQIFWSRLGAAAAQQERTKLGRDLHDGVLQALAAANIQLKILSLSLPPDTQEQLRSVRNILSDEARRIRAFVETSRVTAFPTTGYIPVMAEIEKRVARLRDLWDCQITLSVEPADLAVSVSTIRHVGHMLAEAVSNSVRHGRATSVEVVLEKRHNDLVLSVADNGSGIEGLMGTFSSDELDLARTGPLSLKSRVAETGGKLYLTSSPAGTSLVVELPL